MSAPRPPTQPDRPEVLARFRASLPLADRIAGYMQREMAVVQITHDELQSFAREGLLHASRSFDESKGVPFDRWASLRIRGAVLDGMRQWGSLPKRVYRELRAREAANELQFEYLEEDAGDPAQTPEDADARLTRYLAGIATAIAVGTTMGAPRDSVDPEGRPVTPEDLYESAELMQKVRAIVAELPDAERTIIERHYFQGEQLDEAAKAAGLSKSWGSRLHARAMDTITQKLRGMIET